MRFTSYFEPNFLENEHIILKNVIGNKENKTFTVYLHGDKLLDIISFKKFQYKCNRI